MVYGEQAAVTIPWRSTHPQAEYGSPPSHPPCSLSQVTKSISDNSTLMDPLELMQNLSVIDSIHPKAQQDPHSAWLRMVPMVVHFGQADLESKEVGVALISTSVKVFVGSSVLV